MKKTVYVCDVCGSECDEATCRHVELSFLPKSTNDRLTSSFRHSVDVCDKCFASFADGFYEAESKLKCSPFYREDNI